VTKPQQDRGLSESHKRGQPGSIAGRWPRHLRSQRLLLRAIAPSDPEPNWLAEAQVAVRGGHDSCPLPLPPSAHEPRAEPPGLNPNGDAEAAYWLRPANHPADATPKRPPHDPIGACAARIENDSLVWTWLAIGADWRALGLGGAAVPIVERAAAKLGCRSGRVLVPANNGIGLYFWLRLGYRPLPAADWPKPVDGTWMHRDLSNRDLSSRHVSSREHSPRSR